MADKKDRERVIAENHTFASNASGERTRLPCEPRTGSRISQSPGASVRDVEAHDAGGRGVHRTQLIEAVH